jgi:hypothetical protein
MAELDTAPGRYRFDHVISQSFLRISPNLTRLLVVPPFNGTRPTRRRLHQPKAARLHKSSEISGVGLHAS